MSFNTKMDKTAFSAMSIEEADNEMNDFTAYTWQERLAYSYYLNSVVFGYVLQSPPRMDKTFCEPRNLKNGHD